MIGRLAPPYHFGEKVMTQNACFDGCYFSIHRLLILGNLGYLFQIIRTWSSGG
jgi:hypothetical protein